jgi:hypothetical protein
MAAIGPCPKSFSAAFATSVRVIAIFFNPQIRKRRATGEGKEEKPPR